MFFTCELKRLRQLKAALIARYRCEQILATLPNHKDYRIENCEENAALKEAEENLKFQKKIAAAKKKKKLRTTTLVTAIVSLVATALVAFLLLRLTLVPAALVIVGGTLVLTLIVHLIARAIIKKSRPKNHEAIAECEQALEYATEAFEAAKARIEEEIAKQIAFYENLLNNPSTGINAKIQKFTVVHDDDKDYNTVCQLIWCFEHKYASSVKEAKQWIERSKHSKFVRGRLNQLTLGYADEYDIELDATEGNDDFYTEIPEADAAEA